eukprot:COSAG01_NODE_2202_length_8174_cov_44.528050_6_plen_125_part_00
MVILQRWFYNRAKFLLLSGRGGWCVVLCALLRVLASSTPCVHGTALRAGHCICAGHCLETAVSEVKCCAGHARVPVWAGGELCEWFSDWTEIGLLVGDGQVHWCRWSRAPQRLCDSVYIYLLML